jgi:quercetin dioxygenase-like cupin family protein
MKLWILAIVVLLVGAFAAFSIAGQDPIQVDATIYNKKLENNRVRVFVVVFKPGQAIRVHKHPDHVVHALQGGRIQISEVGKAPVTMDVKTGDTVFLPAQSHSAKNLGKNTLRLLVVELK